MTDLSPGAAVLFPGSYILVVDDEPSVRGLLTRFLEASGYDVLAAVDSDDAMRAIGACQPAVVLCDIHMPGRDGIWLANQIRTESVGTAVVLVTSDDTVPPTESMRPGVVAYVLKPFDRQAVDDAVRLAVTWFERESGLVVPTRKVAPEVPSLEPLPVPPAVIEKVPRRRWRGWFALLALVIAGAIAGGYWRYARPARTLALIEASAGVVTVQDSGGTVLGQGSGFFVAPDIFVTSHHVIAGSTVARIALADGSEMTALGLLASDRPDDVVLLKTSASSLAYLPVDATPVTVGDDVVVYGAPLGLRGTLSRGIISAAAGPQGVLQISAPISPGSSGSPVVNARGAVIGVVMSQALGGQSVNFASPARYLQALLDQSAALRPLVAASRGKGDDLEREQLFGPVRSVTVVASDHDSDGLWIFDRQGLLIEQTLPDGVTRKQYSHDAGGQLETAVTLSGDVTVDQVTFSRIAPLVVEARWGRDRRSSRRLTYADDGRLLLDEVRLDDHALRTTRWTYPRLGWPAPLLDSTVTGEAAGETLDAVGNVTRQVVAGEVNIIDYEFDARHNWVSRETIRVDGRGNRAVTRRQRRTIVYW